MPLTQQSVSCQPTDELRSQQFLDGWLLWFAKEQDPLNCYDSSFLFRASEFWRFSRNNVFDSYFEFRAAFTFYSLVHWIELWNCAPVVMNISCDRLRPAVFTERRTTSMFPWYSSTGKVFNIYGFFDKLSPRMFVPIEASYCKILIVDTFGADDI